MLMICAFMFVSCEEEEPVHTHQYTETVTTAATCTAPGVKTLTCSCGDTKTEAIAQLAHNYQVIDSTDATCTEAGEKTLKCSCGATKTEVIPVKPHDYAKTETKAPSCSEAGEYSCVCNVCGGTATEEIPTLDHVDADENGQCDECGGAVHVHKATAYQFGNSTHWKVCTDCGKKFAEGVHEYDEKYQETCDICGYDVDKYGHEHTYEDEWSYDNSQHWKNSNCGHTRKGSQGIHSDKNNDYICDVCGGSTLKRYDPEEKIATYNWGKTTLYVCLNESSNDYELSSELRRYLAGDTKTDEYIDSLVKTRNEVANKKTNVNIAYSYWGNPVKEKDDAGWGKTVQKTIDIVMANAEGSPDIYCNQIYDMVSASLKKCFANIRTTRMSGGDNNFSFVEEDYVTYSSKTGNELGYMMEYMTELGFSIKKQYLIASDYFIDLVRAFFVVPMNLTLLSSIDPTMTDGDLNGDNKFTVDDFYKMVMEGDKDGKRWTYEKLIQYSAAVYSNTSSSATGSINDINGFILTPSNGMYSSALLYTTSIKIFERKLNKETGFYECTYPEENKQLEEFCAALSKMVNSKGVHVEAVKHTVIRDKFTSNNVLFGGIILLGSLEYESYQDMKNSTSGGFGILPVPVYREGDKYLTIIHNMGRIAAIAANTTKFAQCSAYIDYQSTHSTAILNQYYKYQLELNVAGGTEGNTAILEYIRANVRSAFDKTYEDAIGYYFKGVDANSSKNSWAGVLSQYSFDVPSIRDFYISNKTVRKGYLDQIIKEYADLPE